jgi:hypothetical protein
LLFPIPLIVETKIKVFGKKFIILAVDSDNKKGISLKRKAEWLKN